MMYWDICLSSSSLRLPVKYVWLIVIFGTIVKNVKNVKFHVKMPFVMENSVVIVEMLKIVNLFI